MNICNVVVAGKLSNCWDRFELHFQYKVGYCRSEMSSIQPMELQDPACGPCLQHVEMVWHMGWTWYCGICSQYRRLVQGVSCIWHVPDQPCDWLRTWSELGHAGARVEGSHGACALCQPPVPFAVPIALGPAHVLHVPHAGPALLFVLHAACGLHRVPQALPTAQGTGMWHVLHVVSCQIALWGGSTVHKWLGVQSCLSVSTGPWTVGNATGTGSNLLAA